MPKTLRTTSKTSRNRSDHKRAAPGRSTTAAKKTPVRSTRTPARTPARSRKSPQPSIRSAIGSISAERKLDILGILLALLGLVTTLSLLSTEQGTVMGWWVKFLSQAAGWGMFVLPLALLALGLWLVLRRMDQFPTLSAERLGGVVLLYLNILSWMHLLAGGGWELAKAGKGGGYLGGIFEWLFTGTTGKAGAVILLVAWLLVALILLFDLSLPDLARKLRTGWRNLLNREAREGARRSSAQPPLMPLNDDDSPHELPGDLKPLPEKPSRTARARIPAREPAAPAEPATLASAKDPNWQIPTVEQILDPPTPATAQTHLEQERARLIEETLAAFGAPARVVEIHRGPTVTQFGVEPDFIETRNGRTRVRVGKIASLQDDLKLALAASSIRIEAPVPGRNYVGIEVPNTEISRVALREVMESESFQRIRSPLRLALGKNVSGKPVSADLTAMPHLLIAGTTGSGKSVCVNSILSCLLLSNSPADLRLVLVDPKRVELTGYNGVPHLLAPVLVEPERVAGALQWMQREMDARYHKFSQEGTRNILDHNTKHPEARLPYIVMVIDELADLMMIAPEETERSITRLAQLARATGIHLIIATQRPSVDVVTGLIKANFPARIAFAVASMVDSRVILDAPGAERLLGRGDMLFQSPDAPAPVRLQGVYVSDSEIQRLVDTWRVIASQAVRSAEVPAGGPVDSLPAGVPLHQTPLWDDINNGSSQPEDRLLNEAIDLVRREGRASITMLQRRLGVGYSRAARLIDALEERGIVSPPQGNTNVREVLDYGPTAPPEDDGY